LWDDKTRARLSELETQSTVAVLSRLWESSAEPIEPPFVQLCICGGWYFDFNEMEWKNRHNYTKVMRTLRTGLMASPNGGVDGLMDLDLFSSTTNGLFKIGCLVRPNGAFDNNGRNFHLYAVLFDVALDRGTLKVSPSRDPFDKTRTRVTELQHVAQMMLYLGNNGFESVPENLFLFPNLLDLDFGS
jgi:hypothetical protein